MTNKLIRDFPIFSRFISLILIFVLIFIVYIKIYWLDAYSDSMEGTLVVPFIAEKTEVYRNKNNVVTINANNDSDVYYGMGVVHAQDRLWQLEVQRRLVRGELSEIFGAESLKQDTWIRTLGILDAAISAKEHLPPDVLKSLESYVAGINYWISFTQWLPPEFVLFNVKPKVWTVEDCLAWSKIFALNLSGNIFRELEKYTAFSRLPPELANVFFNNNESKFADLSSASRLSGMSETSNTIVNLNLAEPFVNNTLDTYHYVKDKWKLGGKAVGSNGWVISGKYTKNGAPILSNDPHLGLQVPSLWYAVEQKGKTLNAKGMSLVGLPLVILGSNKRIAWGITNMMADTQDLVILPQGKKLSHESSVYQYEKQKITVRMPFPMSLHTAQKQVDMFARHTNLGPVLNDGGVSSENLISLKWPALAKDDVTYSGFYYLSYASDWDSFKFALEKIVSPALNFIYADISGNIGLKASGRIPIRKNGDGSLPVYAADGDDNWKGFIPFKELPEIYNPVSGVIVNANNENMDVQYPYLISTEFAPSDRAKRIELILKKKIDAGELLSIDDMSEIQSDVFDKSALELINQLHQGFPGTFQQSDVGRKLILWDGFASGKSIGATIFYFWFEELKKELFADELASVWNKPEDNQRLMGLYERLQPSDISRLLLKDKQWCDKQNTISLESCGDIIASALVQTQDNVSRLLGTSDKWQWSKASTLLFAHLPASNFRLLDLVFERCIEGRGNENTVNVASGYYDKNEGFIQNFSAGFRHSIELLPESPQNYFQNSTGQSGVFFHSSYDDNLKYFEHFRYQTFEQPDNYKKMILCPLDEEC